MISSVSSPSAITGASDDLFPAGLLERFARAGWVVGFHAGKVVLPQQLAFFYPNWIIDTGSWLTYLPNLAIVTFVGVAWSQRDGWGRPALLGVGWYLALMFPVMGFFDIFLPSHYHHIM